MAKLKVYIIDDHPVFRRGLVGLLQDASSFEVVGQAESGAEALKEFEHFQPDIILLDIEMPQLDGPELLRLLRNKGIKSKVIILSQNCDHQRIKELIDIGVDGHVLKSDDTSEIIRAIDAVSSSRCYFSSQVAERFVEILKVQLAQNGPENFEQPVLVIPSISPRERQIARLIADGKTNKAMALELNCSEHTIKCHKANLMRKINAHNSAEVVAWSLRMSII
ncbi:MAG: response regulator [Oligoflexus sp.]